MLKDLSEDVKKILLAGIGAAAITAEKSKEVVEELVKKGEITIEQGKVLNEELKHTIKEKVNAGKKEFFDIEEQLASYSEEELEKLKETIEKLQKGGENDDQ